MKYAWIKKNTRLFPTTVMCRVLQVSTSGYYDSVKRQPSAQYIRRTMISQAVAKSYFESKRVYGYRKVYGDLTSEQIQCCDETVRRVMRELGLYSRMKRKFVVTTHSEHLFKCRANADSLFK